MDIDGYKWELNNYQSDTCIAYKVEFHVKTTWNHKIS